MRHGTTRPTLGRYRCGTSAGERPRKASEAFDLLVPIELRQGYAAFLAFANLSRRRILVENYNYIYIYIFLYQSNLIKMIKRNRETETVLIGRLRYIGPSVTINFFPTFNQIRRPKMIILGSESEISCAYFRQRRILAQ